jgi:iron complex outermembrane receptor protein
LYQNKKLSISSSIITSYVLSTVNRSVLENSETLHRQLIYTPRYSVNGNIVVNYNSIQLYIYHQYMGYRFISSDNLQWLEPFHTSSAKISYSKNVKKLRTTFFAASNNIMNVNYSIMAGRPMPLRNYEVGVNLQIHRPKNIN